jgi:lipopolysaccharide/colanic/teichoic acid biosynthesis glycosyltransferase
MAKRLFDLVVAATALVVLAPVFLCAAVGIRLSSPGPIFYRARRVGRDGHPFTMYKFRTMCVNQGPQSSPITAPNDARIFRFGSWLRRLKIDELPQFYNVLRGDMSVVGPRPEDPSIVEEHYTPAYSETLRVLPGLTSPASIYDYTHGDRILDRGDPDQVYSAELLPVKMALDTVYLRKASFLFDLRIIFRTIWVIGFILLGRRRFRDPPEMEDARTLLLPADQQNHCWSASRATSSLRSGPRPPAVS